MIIEAKANRKTDDADQPHKRFEFNAPEKTSRLPLYVALMITGIAAFVKSAFAAQPQGPLEEPHPEQGKHGIGAGSSGMVVAAADETAVDDTTTGSIGELPPRNTIGGVMSPWIDPFVMPDPISFHYAAPSFENFGPQVAMFFPAAVGYRPQNDNIPIARPVGGSRPTTPVVVKPGDDDDEPNPGPNDPDDDDDDDDDDEEPNRAPVVLGPVRLHDVFAGQVMLIGLSQLLFGASDPDGDVLTINDITVTGGTLTQVGGAWSFATLPGMLGLMTFTYKISDGLVHIVQTALLEVVRNSVTLTPGHDVFVGTPWDDDIDGLAGDDLIDARAGNDVVAGGRGDDHIIGGDGDDQLFGGWGDDIILGGRGDDLIGGGEGDDRLFGEEGNDIIHGDAGDDQLFGGAGNDILDGGTGDDELSGDDGDDVLVAGLGDDIANGGAGNDIIQGNAGDDTLSGEAGDDAIDGGDGDDTLDGGSGNDTIAGACGDDTLLGAAGDDHLDGGEGSDTLDGGIGNDTLLGGAGDDAIHGGEGDDTIAAGDGDDEISGDAGNDHIDGGQGYDILDYSTFTADIHIDFEVGVATSDDIDEDLFKNVEQVMGGQGNDTFVFGATTAVVAGGGGDDLFIFTLTDELPTLSRQLVYEILDFVVGDRIHVADYEISSRAERLEAERFSDIYDAMEEGFESGLPIRVSHAFYDDMDHTIIEADVDRNDFYEISITLDGVHLPLTIGHHVA